jgi:hypothetical protein
MMSESNKYIQKPFKKNESGTQEIRKGKNPMSSQEFIRILFKWRFAGNWYWKKLQILWERNAIPSLPNVWIDVAP